MLPLGIACFLLAIVPSALSLGLLLTPYPFGVIVGDWNLAADAPWLSIPLAVLLFVTLHLVRAVGRIHGLFAKLLLVWMD
ncbi:MAG: hypothetical protein QM581_06085 [Pseudomonas sp.]